MLKHLYPEVGDFGGLSEVRRMAVRKALNVIEDKTLFEVHHSCLKIVKAGMDHGRGRKYINAWERVLMCHNTYTPSVYSPQKRPHIFHFEQVHTHIALPILGFAFPLIYIRITSIHILGFITY